MHNATRRGVTITWVFLNSQLTVYLIANPIMLLNIRKVRSKDAIHVHYNSGVKVVDRVSDLPGYGTVRYEPTGIEKKSFYIEGDKKSSGDIRH